MQKAEKKIFTGVGVAFILVLAFTAYMEMSTQEKQSPSKKTAASVTIPEAPKVWVIPKGLTAAALPDSESKGATVLLLYCALCHDLPSPNMHSADEWHVTLRRMDKRIQAQRGSLLTRIRMPPEKDWKTLEQYLIRYAQKPLNGMQLSQLQQMDDWDSNESQTFRNTCSQCHAIPDPSQHTANEWPRIVLRMKMNIRNAKANEPDTRTTEQIIMYLQRHAKT